MSTWRWIYSQIPVRRRPVFNSVYCFKIKFRHLATSFWEYFTLGETRLTLYKWVFSCFDLFKWLQRIQNWTIVDTDSPYYSLPHNKLVGNSQVSRVLYMSHKGVNDLPVHSQQELAQLLWTIKLQDPQACPQYQDCWLKKHRGSDST